MSILDLHVLLDDAFNDDIKPIMSLRALGNMKDPMREREVALVRQCRAEGATWADIAQALHRSEDILSVLYPAREYP